MGLEQVQSMVRELRSHMPRQKRKEKKIAQNTEGNSVINQQDTINMHVTFPLMPAEH